jgi:hypothetical protein
LVGWGRALLFKLQNRLTPRLLESHLRNGTAIDIYGTANDDGS